MWNEGDSLASGKTLRVPGARGGDVPEGRWVDSMADGETLRGPAGIRDDGRTDGGRRWKAGEEILGRYVVERELGQGGMGVVYECLDKVGGVKVAVKCLPPELSHDSGEMEEVRENFELVVGLRHPNIAGVRTLEQDARGEYFLVMDVAEGESLRRWMRRRAGVRSQESGVRNLGAGGRGGLPLEEAVEVLRQVAAALDYAHGEKIVHRDVKPGNVMIDGRGRVKVLDFGLAAQIRTSLSRASQAYRGTSGTGPYMAPEQWEGQPQDEKTDQYALGVLAYEMLAGRPPFESSELGVLREVVLKGEVRGIAGLSEGAMGALRRALAKKAEERWESCGAFVEALAEGRGAGSRPAARAARMADDARAATDPARGGEDLFVRKVRLEKAMGAAREEDATEEEQTALEGVQEQLEAGAEALRAGDTRSAERLFAQVEGGLAAWRKGLRDRREREAELAREQAEREAREREAAEKRRKEAELQQNRRRLWKTLAAVVAVLAVVWGGTQCHQAAKRKRIAAELERIAGEVYALDLGGGVKLEMVACPWVARDFWMGKYEVTQEQWERVMGENPSEFAGKPKNPVENVSWNDCQEFVKSVNGLPEARASGLTFRLPEAWEWEKACRAGAPESADYCKLRDGTQITKGTLGKVARYGKGWGDGPKAVGSLQPNAWGLYDMHGNVWEWTQTADGDLRVYRGGSFNSSAGSCAAGLRFRFDPDYANRDLGLRLAASGRAATR